VLPAAEQQAATINRPGYPAGFRYWPDPYQLV
jgi:hypothetical protein